MPKVSRTSNSGTLTFARTFPFQSVAWEYEYSVVLTIRNSSCLLNELRKVEYFRRGTEISKYPLKTAEHLRNTRELTVAPAQLDKTATDYIRKNLQNVISTYFQVFYFFFPEIRHWQSSNVRVLPKINICKTSLTYWHLFLSPGSWSLRKHLTTNCGIF